ncbi:MAG: hypothetical protein V8S97_04800 [Oscillospiraceae bacterium]
MSLTDGQGRPYAVPVNQAVDEEYHVVYFHFAEAGEKWELLKDGAEVCLSAKCPTPRRCPTPSPWPMPAPFCGAGRRW